MTFLDLENHNFWFPKMWEHCNFTEIGIYITVQVTQFLFFPPKWHRSDMTHEHVAGKGFSDPFKAHSYVEIHPIWIAYVLLCLPFKQTDGIFPVNMSQLQWWLNPVESCWSFVFWDIILSFWLCPLQIVPFLLPFQPKLYQVSMSTLGCFIVV